MKQTRILFILALFAVLLPVASGGEEKPAAPSINLSGNSTGDLMYGIIMANFYNRSLENTGAAILDLVENHSRPGEPLRLRLAMTLAKLGGPEAEKALELLESWEGDFDASEDEAMRLGNMGDLNLYYLGRPAAAVDLYKRAMETFPPFEQHILSSLFSAYANSAELFDIAKMKEYLNRQGEYRSEVQYFINKTVAFAADGYSEEARGNALYLENNLDDEGGVMLVYAAPAWGWLGDVDKVVEYLEPGLQNLAIIYAPAGFRLYCDWLRQSPAYNGIREDEKFKAMWERLYAFEPEARGSNIMVPPFE